MTITPDTSPSTDSNNVATNLIMNLSNRSSSHDGPPINSVDAVEADYESCFEVFEEQISSTGHLFKFGVNLGEVYFQHSILNV